MPPLSGPARPPRRPRRRLGPALLTGLLLPVLALTSVLAQPSSPAGAASTLRLMIAGDSISHEFAGDYTWRYRLREEFSRQQVGVDFVGPRTGNTGGLPLIPFSDDQHDALGGTLLSIQKDDIGQDITDYHPDVVLVMIGFNDLNHGHPAQTVIADMDTYLGNLFQAGPDTTVVLSHVLDNVIYPGSEHRHIDLAGVNAGYDDLVAKYQGQGRKISIADETAPWVPGREMTVDGVHPTSSGEMVIATHYATSLHQIDRPDAPGVKILPQPSGIPLGYVPWVTQAHPVVHQLAHRRIQFSWDYWTSRLTIYRGVLLLWGGHLSHPITVYAPYFTSSLTKYLPRGYYGVRLSPTRKWLVGRWGPPVHFTVH